SVEACIDQGPGAGLPVGMDANQKAGFAGRMNAHVGELTALVDDLISTGFIDDRLGYWGMSMGTALGLRFVASEPRVKAAVPGLVNACVAVTWTVSEVGSPSSAASGYVPTPSKSHFADTMLPGAGGTSICAVRVTASPTATSARSPPFTLRWTTGWMPLRSAADAGTCSWPCCTPYSLVGGGA